MRCMTEVPLSEGSPSSFSLTIRKYDSKSQKHLVRNYPVGALFSVWLPKQIVTIMLRGLVLVFRKFSSRPIIFWCRKVLPVGAIILGWEFFSAKSEF